MFYRSCPMCGRSMAAHVIYSKLRSPRLTFVCPCGFQTDKDMSGLTYNNFVDRYKFDQIQVIADKES